MKIIIGAGGTGGHLYPALALAEYIETQRDDIEFLFVGTTDRLESRVIPNKGYNYKGLKVKGLTGNILEKTKHALIFVNSLKESKKILKEFKPDVVIGFGGYPSASIVLAAANMRIPTVIHEQNSIIGLTNKILIKKVDKIICCYEAALDIFPKEKSVLLGNPRASVVSSQKLKDIHDIYDIPKDKKTVVVVMGSLGSESVNNTMKESLRLMQNNDYHVIYVTGKDYFENMKKELSDLKENIHLVDYIDDMPSLISSCDLIVSRAGATTLAEITALGAASLLIPSPYVVANHQEYNAKELVDKNAAEWLLEKDLNPVNFVDMVNNLLNNERKLKQLKENATKLGKPNACKDIWEEVLETLEK